MKLKKYFSLILTLVILTTIFTGCSVSTNVTTADTNEKEDTTKNTDEVTSGEIKTNNKSKFITKSGEVKYFEVDSFVGGIKKDKNQVYDRYFIPIGYLDNYSDIYLAYAANTKIVFMIYDGYGKYDAEYYLNENLNYCKYNTETGQIEEFIKD